MDTESVNKSENDMSRDTTSDEQTNKSTSNDSNSGAKGSDSANSNDNAKATAQNEANMQSSEDEEVEFVEATEADGESDESEQLIIQLQDALEQQKENALRAQAEMQNVRRRAENEVSNARRYALEGFLKDLISILDSFDGALKTEIEDDWPESARSMHSGIEGIAKQFNDIFNKYNIVVDAPQQGEKFDPQIHEAVTMVAVPGVGKDQVVETVRTGYRLNDRVIRPAMVVVSTGG